MWFTFTEVHSDVKEQGYVIELHFARDLEVIAEEGERVTPIHAISLEQAKDLARDLSKIRKVWICWCDS